MKKTFFLCALFISVGVMAQNWKQDSTKTEVEFTIKNFGINVDGRFGQVAVITNFSAENPEKSTLSANIAVNTIETGIEGRDKHLLKEDYFFQSKYPVIRLQSTSIKKVKSDEYLLKGKLTIKDTTKEVMIPLAVTQTEKTIQIAANFRLNRRDFNIGGGSLVLSKKVKIKVRYYGIK